MKIYFVACHNKSYVGKYDMISEMKDNGTWTGSFSEKYAADRAARYEKERAAREQIAKSALGSIFSSIRTSEPATGVGY